MNHLSNMINDSYIKVSKRLLELANGISGIYLITYVTYSSFIISVSESESSFTDVIFSVCLCFVLFYNENKLRNRGKKYSAVGLYLRILGLLFLFLIVYISTVYLTISTNYIAVLLGILIPFAYFWYIFITVLRSEMDEYNKIFMMIGIYLICILGIAAMFIPVNVYDTEYQKADFSTIFLVSLKISYSLPEVSRYYQINILHIIQFLFCKIFDVLILGTVINLISDIVKGSKGSSEIK